MPDEQDYLDLELSLEDTRSFVAQVSRDAPALVDQARDPRRLRCVASSLVGLEWECLSKWS
ncbi:MAG: hypothetical protein QOF40_884 [Actinomycetota bacterium]|nr:hypothetical protein [Actinomycetota bacterium]